MKKLAGGGSALNCQFYTNSSMSYVLEAPPTANAGQDGTRLLIAITIGNLGYPAAGNYSDTITITVTVQ